MSRHIFQVANRGVFEKEGTILNVSVLSSRDTITPALDHTHPNLAVHWFSCKDFMALDGTRVRIYYASDGSWEVCWYQKIQTGDVTAKWTQAVTADYEPEPAPAYSLRSVFTEVLAKL